MLCSSPAFCFHYYFHTFIFIFITLAFLSSAVLPSSAPGPQVARMGLVYTYDGPLTYETLYAFAHGGYMERPGEPLPARGSTWNSSSTVPHAPNDTTLWSAICFGQLKLDFAMRFHSPGPLGSQWQVLLNPCSRRRRDCAVCEHMPSHLFCAARYCFLPSLRCAGMRTTPKPPNSSPPWPQAVEFNMHIFVCFFVTNIFVQAQLAGCCRVNLPPPPKLALA